MPYTIAASIFIALGIGLLYHQIHNTNPSNITENPQLAEPVPGGNKAILTLANGKRIELDSAANGSLALEGETKISKSDRMLTYSNTNGAPGETVYNDIEVPYGGKYEIVLADGTKVWLNAGTSLRFPTSFTGAERRVQLTGEAYFEVAKNKEMPFHVEAANVNITVLGTHFNVSAYRDEQIIQTTLLEGSVEVSNNTNKALLKPGEEAELLNDGNAGNKITVSIADVEKVTAWKKGLFIFHDDDIKDIMQALKRWYNVSVNYKTNVSKHLSGTFDRNEPLMKILHYLEGTNEVHFEVRGKNITVLK